MHNLLWEILCTQKNDIFNRWNMRNVFQYFYNDKEWLSLCENKNSVIFINTESTYIYQIIIFHTDVF